MESGSLYSTVLKGTINMERITAVPRVVPALPLIQLRNHFDRKFHPFVISQELRYNEQNGNSPLDEVDNQTPAWPKTIVIKIEDHVKNWHAHIWFTFLIHHCDGYWRSKSYRIESDLKTPTLAYKYSNKNKESCLKGTCALLIHILHPPL